MKKTHPLGKEYKKEEVKPVSNPLDLNNDGKVDEKDTSIAGKVLEQSKKKKK